MILRLILCGASVAIVTPCHAQSVQPTTSVAAAWAGDDQQRRPIEVDPTASEDLSRELVSVLKRREAAQQRFETRDAPEWFRQMAQRIVRENLPIRYVVDKDWGRTDRRWDGLRVRRDGFQIRTKRRWKEVNHGTWRRYELTQLDPSHNLSLAIEDVRDLGEGKVGFDINLSSKIRAFARQSQWAKGVQLFSVSAEADAAVRMRIRCELGIQLDLQNLPPDLLLVPEVTQTDLDVSHFQLASVSKLDGPVVKQLGRGLHKVLREKIADTEPTLPAKINRQIDKNRDKLRFSISDFATNQWKALTSPTIATPTAAREATTIN